MAEQWRELARMNGEEHSRLYKKKAKIATMLQDELEDIMETFVLAPDLNIADRLVMIETIWRVLGLEYIQAAEREKLEREK